MHEFLKFVKLCPDNVYQLLHEFRKGPEHIMHLRIHNF